MGNMREARLFDVVATKSQFLERTNLSDDLHVIRSDIAGIEFQMTRG